MNRAPRNPGDKCYLSVTQRVQTHSAPNPPPTHRPLLRLCHYNPQAGFLSPRWAGDSTCEQNSPARAASRNYYLFLAWQLSLDSRSVVTLYVLVWGLGRSASRGLKKHCQRRITFWFSGFIFGSCGQVYREQGGEKPVLVCLLAFWLIDKEQPHFWSVSKHFCRGARRLFVTRKQANGVRGGQRKKARATLLIPKGTQLLFRWLF